MPFKSEKQRKWMHANQPEMAKKWEKEEKNEGSCGYTHTADGQPLKTPGGTGDDLEETAKRDYKAEYKKFQSSPKSKKYRAELNKYNRKKGTYGNGDGKDASHKGGKIAGFEKESVNRGRREKSRLKQEGDMLDREREKQTSEKERLRDKHMKDLDRTREKEKRAKKQFESKLREMIQGIILDEGFAGTLKKEDRKKFDSMRRKQSEVLGYTLTGQNDVKVEVDDATVHQVGHRAMKETKLKEQFGRIIKATNKLITEGAKYDEIKANMEKTMGLLVRKMGLKSVVRHLVGKGCMSFFLDDPKEAKKLQKFLLTKIKDVRIVNLDKKGGDEANFVVYAKVFDF